MFLPLAKIPFRGFHQFADFSGENQNGGVFLCSQILDNRQEIDAEHRDSSVNKETRQGFRRYIDVVSIVSSRFITVCKCVSDFARPSASGNATELSGRENNFQEWKLIIARMTVCCLKGLWKARGSTGYNIPTGNG